MKTIGQNKKGIIIILVVLFLASLSINIGHFIKNEFHCSKHFSFINPRFACNQKPVINKKEYRDLRAKLVDYIDEQKKQGNVNTVSLFFRDLEAGPTMGIEERLDFVPASLLKLPNALLLFRLEEQEEKDVLAHTISYSKSSLDKSSIKTTSFDILPDTPYTIKQLIEHSLVYSDNIANRLLIQHINSIDEGRGLIREIYRDLGILEVEDTISTAVTTKGYASIFRLLYNSSFLNPQHSEELLSIMTQSIPVQGIRTGTPASVKVAHKFGERDLPTENQFHDCGIVYYPGNPYLLCVMTRGTDVKHLAEVIETIARLVYEEVDSRRL